MGKLGRCTRFFCNALDKIEKISIKTMLDIGCGEGRTLDLTDRFSGATRIGADINMKSLKKAKEKCLAVLASGKTLPFKREKLDLIMEFHTFHHIPGYEGAVREVGRCLKDGGYFVLVEAVNDNPLFAVMRRVHPVAKEMPIESNFKFQDLLNTLKENEFSVEKHERFGLIFELTLGAVPGMPFFIRKVTGFLDSALEKVFGTRFCASCVIVARKRKNTYETCEKIHGKKY